MLPDPPMDETGDVYPGQLDLLEDVAFDEMNIIELPFALLTRDTTDLRAHLLSPNGAEKIVADESVEGLPSALAERVVMALMWLTRQQNSFTDPMISFSLRDLVVNYVFPGRFNATYTPGKKALNSVEEQIRRVAHTRLISNRWFDRALNKQVRIDASIIDYLKVIDEGGPKRPRMLEIRWGSLFFQSVRNQYTKPIDLATYQRIEAPLDRRLYRWLDRQLATKPIQAVKSCQYFARYKLAMTGSVVQSGGRGASNYIVKSIKESLERLAEFGFAVALAVDASSADFSLTFSRASQISSRKVIVEDVALDLVRHFEHVAHGLPLDSSSRAISERDRDMATRWLQDYGAEPSRWMIERAVALQKEQGAQRILKFMGLERYEAAAAGDYRRHEEQAVGQLSMQFRMDLPQLYRRYCDALASVQGSEEEERQFETEAHQNVSKNPILRGASAATVEKMVRGEVRERRLEHHRVISQNEFSAYSTETDLRTALIERHGFDPLA